MGTGRQGTRAIAPLDLMAVTALLETVNVSCQITHYFILFSPQISKKSVD